MSYRVKYEDIGLSEYKKTWDYQAEVFNRITEYKKRIISDEGTGLETPPGHLIFVEHPHVYTLGKSGSENNLLLDMIQLRAKDASFFRTDRGGDITYHGPGQLVGYPVFDLEAIGIGLKEYVSRLEEVIIQSIKNFGLEGCRLSGATGVWLDTEVTGKTRKICAIGVKASKYVTMHGFALNVNTNLAYFDYIHPCGITDKGVTSLEKELGESQDIAKVKSAVKENFRKLFDLELIERER